MRVIHFFALLNMMLWSMTAYSAVECGRLEKTANQLEDIEVHISQYKKFDKAGKIGLKFEQLTLILNNVTKEYKNNNLKRSVTMLLTAYKQNQWTKFSGALSSVLRNIHDIKGRNC